jgi:NTP pyrophosphatase (non-canonical NTP hydrolase)
LKQIEVNKHSSKKQSSSVQPDRLLRIFNLRKNFIKNLRFKIPAAVPEKIDPSSKEGQKYLRDLALYGVEEMFEALQHLKNWKSHRIADMSHTFDRDAFLEEMVDAFNYFFALMIHLDIDADEFFEAFLEKDRIINDRLNSGY